MVAIPVPIHCEISLRDYFAAKAMPSYISDSLRSNGIVDCAEIASFAYKMADAMIAQKERGMRWY